jgi:YD repeat-containing protein
MAVSNELGLNRLATFMDAKGNMTRYQHDAQGNLRSITRADDSAERWGYDAAHTR